MGFPEQRLPTRESANEIGQWWDEVEDIAGEDNIYVYRPRRTLRRARLALETKEQGDG